MKKSKVIVLVSSCAMIVILAISTMVANPTQNDDISKSYKNISHFGLKEFINMDLGIIGYFPEESHWNQISKNIKSIPIDSLRYIDSLDVTKIADTTYVKIYTQNYAYQSKNTYKITKNTNKITDSLMVFDIHVDLTMKDTITEASTFRLKNFTVNYITEQQADDSDQRIIFHKTYQ